MTTQVDGLLNRLLDIEGETNLIRTLLQADETMLPSLLRARVHVYVDEVVSGLAKHRQALADAMRKGKQS